MPTPVSKPHLDRLFAEKNLAEIYWAISVVQQTRDLPEQFWLFSRIYEWSRSRSGVWQYYERLPDEHFKRIHEALTRFEFSDIAQQYHLGHTTWDGPTQAAELDQWLDQNTARIDDALFNLIVDQNDCLTTER
jgi:hypothetical protein